MTPGRRCWSVDASKIARNTHNPIRQIVENMRLEPNPDKKMIALSIGDPTVFGNLRPPLEMIDALHDSIDSFRWNGYGPSTGYEECRAAVAEYTSTDGVSVTSRDVVMCSGCSGALDICITVLADPGKNILVPRPGFSIYRTLAEGLGVVVKSYNLRPEKGWEVDLAHMESLIDDNTAAVIINNPSNPCGSVFSRSHLIALIDIARRHFLPIIADEIYEHLVFPGESFYSLASLSRDVPILSCSGLTKRFLVPGWRTGWIIIHDRNNIFEREVRKGLQCMSQRIIGSNTLVQGAIPFILKNTPAEFYQNTINTLHTHAQLVFKRLARIEGLTPVMPQGAMYMMVGINMALFSEFQNELQFVQQLVTEESVFCLPSQCFDFPHYMRLVLTVPEELLLEACQRISDFCERHATSRSKMACNRDHQLMEHQITHSVIYLEKEGRLGKG